MCFSSSPDPPKPVIMPEKKDVSGTEDVVAAKEADAKKKRLAMSRAFTNLTGGLSPDSMGKTKLGM